MKTKAGINRLFTSMIALVFAAPAAVLAQAICTPTHAPALRPSPASGPRANACRIRNLITQLACLASHH